MEKLKSLIEAEQAQAYKIRNKAGDLLMFRKGDPEILADQIESDYESLPDGNYTLLVGETEKFKESSAEKLTFKIGQTRPAMFNNMNYGSIDIEKIKKEAYEQGYKDAQIKILEGRVDKLEKQMAIVLQTLDESDGEKDGLINKVTDVAELLGTAKDAFGGLKFNS